MSIEIYRTSLSILEKGRRKAIRHNRRAATPERVPRGSACKDPKTMDRLKVLATGCLKVTIKRQRALIGYGLANRIAKSL